jgi:hypothetical protein
MYGISNIEEDHVFQWHAIDWLQDEFEFAFRAFNELFEKQELSLKESIKEFERKISDDLKSIDLEFRDSYRSHYYGEEERMLNEILFIQRNANLLALFSFFESMLKKICDEIQKHYNCKIKVDDLKGEKGDISKYWKYLTKVYEIDDKQVNNYYSNLIEQKFIRNKIAHNDGFINKEELQNVKMKKGLTIKSIQNNKFIIKITDVQYLIDTNFNLSSFFYALIVEVDERFIKLNSQKVISKDKNDLPF